MPFSLLASAAGIYLASSLGLAYLVHRFPRKPVSESPDWGEVTDLTIKSADGGKLEVWRIDPAKPSRGMVLLAHGWSRNRDRMVGRARVFGKLGFSTVIHSARDHGRSSPYRFMNALRFCEDIESVLRWIGRPVILYGHSLGAAASVLAASRNPGMVKMLMLEGCYPNTKRALRQLYGSYGGILGKIFAPGIVEWMNLFYGYRLERVSPARLAPGLDIPVLIIHGDRDEHFPLEDARKLRDSFPAGRAEFFVARGACHSSSSLAPGYGTAIRAFLWRHLPASGSEDNMLEERNQ